METRDHAHFSCLAPFLQPTTLCQEKTHLNIATFCFCQWWESKSGHSRSKQVRCPLHHCLSAKGCESLKHCWTLLDSESPQTQKCLAQPLSINPTEDKMLYGSRIFDYCDNGEDELRLNFFSVSSTTQFLSKCHNTTSDTSFVLTQNDGIWSKCWGPEINFECHLTTQNCNISDISSKHFEITAFRLKTNLSIKKSIKSIKTSIIFWVRRHRTN